MGEIASIKDYKSLEAWLKSGPQEDAVFLAARAAARVAPLWWGSSGRFDVTPLPFLRCCLISSVAVKMPTDEIKAAAAAADAAAAAFDAAAAFAAAAAASFDASDGAAAAAAAAAFSASVGIDLWEHIRADARASTEHVPHHWPPLWAEDTLFAKEWSDVQKRYSGDSWAFWIDWYRRVLIGDPFPEGYLDLLHQIATMPDEDWKGSEDDVNGRIAALYEAYNARRSSLAGSGETVESQESVTSIGRHIRSLTTQAMSFEAYLDTEIHGIAGRNAPLTDAEEGAKDELLTVLRAIYDKVVEMIRALENEQVLEALTVVDTKNSEIASAVEPLAENEATQEVAAHIELFAAHMKVLSESGTPGIIATGIAGLEVLRLKAVNLYEKKGKVRKK